MLSQPLLLRNQSMICVYMQIHFSDPPGKFGDIICALRVPAVFPTPNMEVSLISSLFFSSSTLSEFSKAAHYGVY